MAIFRPEGEDDGAVEHPNKRCKLIQTLPSIVPRSLEPLHSIRLFGDLVLPHPRQHFLKEDGWTQKIIDLLPYISELGSRDLRKLSSRPILDLSSNFKEFATEERLAWIASGSEPELGSHLVQPSGSLDALLVHHLHQPSFTTSIPPSTEVADKTNPCIAMVMGNAYREGDTLIYDHLHRRSRKSEGFATYPQNVLKTHVDFTYRLLASSAAKVEIVYGKPVQRHMLQAMKMTAIPLWGLFKGIIIFLLHEENFQNQDSNYMFRKVLLFAAHPQKMLYQRQMSNDSILQDLTLEVAVKLADPSLKFDPNYYRMKAWQTYVSKSIRMKHISKIEVRDLLSSLQEPLDTNLKPWKTLEPDISVKTPSVNDGTWNTFFISKPYSNDTTRTLLPRAIEALQDVKNNIGGWQTPSRLHSAVAEWLKGQKEVLFHQTAICCASDIIDEVRNNKLTEFPEHLDKDEPISDLTFQAVLKQLMLIQQRQLASIKQCKFEDFLFNRLGADPIQAKCPCGSVSIIDSDPRFSCARPSAYVTRERMCNSIKCNPKGYRKGARQILEPIQNVDFTRATKPTLQVEGPRRQPDENFAPLLRDSTESPQCPKTVELWCIICKKQTETSSGSSVFIDTSARWTIGNTRPLYVERRPRCLSCEKRTGIPGRNFIPKSPDNPSVNPRRLERFWEAYQNYDRAVQAILLDSYLPSLALRVPTEGDEYECERTSTSHAKGSEPFCSEQIPGILLEQGLSDALAIPDICSAPESRSSTEGLIQNSPAIRHMEVQKTRKPLRLLVHQDSLLRLIRDSSCCSQLPSQLEIWCQTCTEKTEISSSSAYRSVGKWAVDRNPKWTIGEPATYIGVKPKCLTCSKTRFVPTDKSIPCISGGGLREWADRNASLTDEEACNRFQKHISSMTKRMRRLGTIN